MTTPPTPEEFAKHHLDQQQQDVITMLNLRSELRSQKIDALVQWHENKNYKEILFETNAEMEPGESLMDWAWTHHSQQASSKISTIVNQMKRGLGRLRTLKSSVFDAMEKAKLATELERVVQLLEERLDALQREKEEQNEALNMFRLHMKEKDNMLSHTLKREETGMKKVNDIIRAMRHVHDRRDQTIRDLLNVAHYKMIPVDEIFNMYSHVRDTYDKKEPQLLEESMNNYEQLKMRTIEIHQQLMIDILKLHQTHEEDMELVKMILDTDVNRPDNQIRKWVRKKLKDRKKEEQIKQKEEQRKLIMDARKKRLATSKSNGNLLRTDSTTGLPVSELQQAQQLVAQIEEEKARMETDHQEQIEEIEERLRTTRSDLIDSQHYIRELKEQLKSLKIKPVKRESTKNMLAHVSSVKSLDKLESEKKALLSEMKKLENAHKSMTKKHQQELSKKEKENQKLLKSSLKAQDQVLNKKEKKKSVQLPPRQESVSDLHAKMTDRSPAPKSKTSNDKKTTKKRLKSAKSDSTKLSIPQNDSSAITTPSARKRKKSDEEFLKRIAEERQKIQEEHKQQLEAFVPGPEGEVVFAFIDVRHSSKLWRANLNAMSKAIKLYHNAVRTRLQLHSGYEFLSNDSDSFACAFANVKDACEFSLYLQLELLQVDWPELLLTLPEACLITGSSPDEILFRGLRVRIGLHVGHPVSDMSPVTRRTQYQGPSVKVAESVMRVADGGEICFSSSVWKHLESFDLTNHLACPAVVKYRERLQLNGLPEGDLDEIRSLLPAELANREFARDLDRKKTLAATKTMSIDKIVAERMQPVIKYSQAAIDAARTLEDESKSQQLVKLIEHIQLSASHVLKKKQLEHAAEISSTCNAALMELYELRRMSIDVRRSLRIYGESIGHVGRDFDELLENIVESQEERQQLAAERQEKLHSIKEERVSHLDNIKKATNSHVQQLSDLIQSMDDEIQMSKSAHDGEASHPSEEKIRAVRKQIIHYHSLLKEQEKRLDELRVQEESIIPPEEQLEVLINQRVESKMSTFLAKHQADLEAASQAVAAEMEKQKAAEMEAQRASEIAERDDSSMESETSEGEINSSSNGSVSPAAASDGALEEKQKTKKAASTKKEKIAPNAAHKTKQKPKQQLKTKDKTLKKPTEVPIEKSNNPSQPKKARAHRTTKTKQRGNTDLKLSIVEDEDEDSVVDETESIPDNISDFESKAEHRDTESIISEDDVSIDVDLDDEHIDNHAASASDKLTQSSQSKAIKHTKKVEPAERMGRVTKDTLPQDPLTSTPLRNGTKARSHQKASTKKAVRARKHELTDDYSIDSLDASFESDDDSDLSQDEEIYAHGHQRKRKRTVPKQQDDSTTLLRMHAYKKEIERLRKALVSISQAAKEKNVTITGAHTPSTNTGAQNNDLIVSSAAASASVEWNSPNFDDTIPILHSIEVQTNNHDLNASVAEHELTAIGQGYVLPQKHVPQKSQTVHVDVTPQTHINESALPQTLGSIQGSPIKDSLSPNQYLTPQKGISHRGFPRRTSVTEQTSPAASSTDWSNSLSSTRIKPQITPQHNRIPHTLEALNTQRVVPSFKQKVVYLSPLPKEEEAVQRHEKKRLRNKQKDLIKFSKKLKKREQELERRELELNLKIKELQAQLRASTHQYYGIPTADESGVDETAEGAAAIVDEQEDLYYVPKFWNVFVPSLKLNPAIRAKHKRHSLDVGGSGTKNVGTPQYRVNQIRMSEDVTQQMPPKETAMRTVNASQWLSKETIKNLSFKEFIGHMVQNDVRKYSLQINKGGRFLSRILGGWTRRAKDKAERTERPLWR